MRTKIRMIAQAHLDPVWLWRWTEGRAEALATSRSAVDRLREYPSFHFTRGEAQVYEWIEQEAPALFEEIRELIREGRWHVVNGMVIQPDMNLPQGESFVRQALLGKRYMQEKLGVDVRVAYCVDSFGHAGTLPQILKKCGFDYYVFMRPQEHEKKLPPQAFWWEGPDGTRLLTHRISGAYNSWDPDVTAKVERALGDRPAPLSDVMCFFGVGNHGGGPTREQIEGVLALAARRDDAEIVFDHPQAYFEAVAPQAADLPVVCDDLQFHATGCYSANSLLKRMHRQAECALLLAERMASLAELWVGLPPDRAALRTLWHDLCFNQFHDILAGSSLKEASDEAIMALGRVTHTAREIANTAGRLIGERVDTSGPGSTVILFNPFPYRYQGYVEYEPWTTNQRWDRFGWGLENEKGEAIPCQATEADAAVGNAERGIERLVFRADLPALGYRVYRLGQGLKRVEAPAQAQVRPDGLENDLLSVTLDPATGNIVSCRDKQTGLELVGPGGWNVGQVLEDTSDTWSHGVRGWDKVLGCFGDARITVADQGPLQASLLLERTWEGSTWLQQLILRAGEREILVKNWLDWHGQWRLVKLACDVAVKEPQGFRDVPFGAFPCPGDGAEVPLHMWIDVSGTLEPAPTPSAGGTVRGGLAILNDGKYAGDVTGSTVRLTVLRCPPYAYHVPHVIGTKRRYDWLDQGVQEFTLALRPHLGDWRTAGVVQRARELNLPAPAVTMYAHAGELPGCMEAAALEGDLELTALKPAEDGCGYILRLADRNGYGGVARLRWQGQEWTLAAKAWEVLTLRLQRAGEGWQATPCDMIERDA